MLAFLTVSAAGSGSDPPPPNLVYPQPRPFSRRRPGGDSLSAKPTAEAKPAAKPLIHRSIFEQDAYFWGKAYSAGRACRNNRSPASNW
jgi:hypothetical protein